jgi:SAM-dependent methyltransferase
MDSALERAAARWSRPDDTGRRHWWQHETVVRHVNRLICGRSVRGVGGGDVVVLRERGPFERGVSVGCGVASKEIALLHGGVVGHFDLFEIAESRVEQGAEQALQLGIADRITWHREPVDFDRPAAVDLVYWNNALHHMLDTDRALAWSRASLLPGGTFYMNDFVGPDRMQWSDEMMEAARRARRELPRSICPDPEAVQRPRAEKLAASDPTECADSAAILPGLARYFPEATIIPTGGVVYALALLDLLDRIGDDLLEPLLELDRAYAEQGLTQYAVAISP